jgi:phospholipase C
VLRRRSFAVRFGRISRPSRGLIRLGISGTTLGLAATWALGSVAVPARATSASAGMVQSFSSALANANSQLAASPTLATTSGDLLVDAVKVRNVNGPLTVVTGISDSGGNAWIRAAAIQSGKTDQEIWYAMNTRGISSSGSVDVTVTAAAAIAMTVIEVRGIAGSAALDVTASRTGSSNAPTTGTTAVTKNADEVAVADIGWNTGVTPSGQTAGYTSLAAAQSKVSGEPIGEQAAVLVLSATGTQSYSATLSKSALWTGVIATFTAAPPPPTPTPSATATPTPSATATPTPSSTPSPTPSGSPIKHVVVMYQENHSFDSLLGAWCAQTGHCIGMPPTVTLKDGTVYTPQQAPTIVPEVDHSVAGQQLAIDGGAMDGWDAVDGCQPTVSYAGGIPYGCLTYYAPSQVPNLITLASKFALSDMTFSEADSPSWGGHLYAVAATTDGFLGDTPGPKSAGAGWGCDSNKNAQWTNPVSRVAQREPSCVPDFALGLPNGGAYMHTDVSYVPTIMDRLDAAGLPWKIYTTTTGAVGNGGPYIWATCPSFAECLDTSQRQNMVPTDQVLSDLAAGTLSAFSLVLPGPGNDPVSGGASQHNGFSITVGDNWIGKLTSAIEASPDWSSTALFITYDDCGCFYDQVPPGLNPDGTQRGVRSPLVIVSPYAISGYVDSTPASFASILAYVERTFGLAPLNVNDAAAYPFTNAFNYAQPPLAPVHMVQTKVPPGAYMDSAANTDDPT